MTKLKVEGDIFYLPDAGNEKRIYDDETDSVKALETTASQKKDINPESLNISEVNKAGERREIEPLPWSRIVIWENAKLKRKKSKPRLFNANICIRH